VVAEVEVTILGGVEAGGASREIPIDFALGDGGALEVFGLEFEGDLTDFGFLKTGGEFKSIALEFLNLEGVDEAGGLFGLVAGPPVFHSPGGFEFFGPA
jgi:hypothetical protein